MTGLFARIERFEPPVDYGAIAPWLQRIRATLAGIILAASVAAGFLSVPGAWIPSAMAAIVLAHALIRANTPHSATEALIIDAGAIAIGLGSSDAHAHMALVAAAAYLISASIALGGLATLAWSLGTYGAALALRPHLPLPSATAMPGAGEPLAWVAALVFLTGVALPLMAAATEVFLAKQTQATALATERRASEMKNSFVSMITHELRTPLTTISGFAETLAETWQTLPPEDVEEFLRIIVSEAGHLQNLVEDVLTIPRLEAERLLLDPADFALRPAAFKVMDLLFPEGADRSASVSVGSDVIVHADPNRVEQVLRNLAENARKYGGDTVAVEAVPRDGEWQIVVADNGAGLPADAEGRVFEAFEQATSGDARSDSGFGLGLAVARHLVEAMGGRIWYEPGFPVGARFCFTLPRAGAEHQTEDVAAVA